MQSLVYTWHNFSNKFGVIWLISEKVVYIQTFFATTVLQDPLLRRQCRLFITNIMKYCFINWKRLVNMYADFANRFCDLVECSCDSGTAEPTLLLHYEPTLQQQ